MKTLIDAMRNLPAKQLRRAVAIKEKMDGLEREFANIIGNLEERVRTAPRKYRLIKTSRKPISAAGRARMARAARKRWRRTQKRGTKNFKRT